MTIEEIYTTYKTVPSLQMHMLRVASVAKLICDSFTTAIDTENIVKASLLHDMGNIIKFKMDVLPELFEPEGVMYWTQIKNEYIEKYGKDEHYANLAIAKEIGVSERIFDLLSHVGFSQAQKNLSLSDIGYKICCYADMRVTPKHIVSLIERMFEGRERYKKNKELFGDENFDMNAKALEEMEKQIFSQCTISPSTITDEKVQEIISSAVLQKMII